MDVVQSILVSVPTGIITSFIFLLIIYKRSRPNIEISENIAHLKNDSFNIKVINKTNFEIINIRAKMYRVKVSNITNGTLKTHAEIKLEKDELFALGKFEKKAIQEDYGWRFKTKEDLVSYLQKGEFIKFQVIAQNSYSNAIKVFEKRFDSLKNIKKGAHVYGQKMDVN